MTLDSIPEEKETMELSITPIITTIHPTTPLKVSGDNTPNLTEPKRLRLNKKYTINTLGSSHQYHLRLLFHHHGVR